MVLCHLESVEKTRSFFVEYNIHMDWNEAEAREVP